MSFDTNGLLAAVEHLAGFLVVLTALSLLWGLTELMGWLFVRRVAKTSRPSPDPVSSGSDGPVASPLVPEDLVVVAAAVAYLINEPHHIVSVRSHPSSWGLQGRRDIHASHRIR